MRTMANNFRNNQPIRTCCKSYANYRHYKSDLANDFNKRCGYTDCPDHWFGGSNTFHIDHFKPWKKYPDLKTNYSNLVYCCSYVNILKSDDEGNYIDPCDIDFNRHFQRDSEGNIIPISNEAKYMFKKLKLYMKRYQTIWMLDEIQTKMQKVKAAIQNEKDVELKNSLLITQGELANLFLEYINYLTASQ